MAEVTTDHWDQAYNLGFDAAIKAACIVLAHMPEDSTWIRVGDAIEALQVLGDSNDV